MLFLLSLSAYLAAAVLLYLTYRISLLYGSTGCVMRIGPGWLLEKTPALDAFIVFVLKSKLAAATLISSFTNKSKHLLINLDILCSYTSMLIIFLHLRRETPSLHLMPA